MVLGALGACSGDSNPGTQINGGNTGGTETGTAGAGGGTGATSGSDGFGGTLIDLGNCGPETCAELGWACGYTVNNCGDVIDCAEEGLTCAADQSCVGGIDGPTECVASNAETCELCAAIPDCSAAPQPTRLSGRVISPGRDDADTGNQVAVPNALVYILRNNDASVLPPISTGIPTGGTSCDRCEDQDLGPVLAGAVTDAAGNFVIEGNVPVGTEFLLVVKAGKFRRAVAQTLAPAAACTDAALPIALPDNPARLPRNSADGIAANIPRIAVTTGQIDAMECVFEKMGIAQTEFGNPGADGTAAQRIHLYRGINQDGNPAGARIDDATPADGALYSELGRLQSYDMIVADCEGLGWDDTFAERNASGANVREYVNRGGRMFASHLSFSWLHENDTTAFNPDTPIATGLAAAGTWATGINTATTGSGKISIERPNASPRIQNFADWMQNEGITTPPANNFTILEPRSQSTGLGEFSEEFVHLEDGTERTQQFSFNTPYGAPEEAACGRVAYSGFHVSVGGGNSPFADATFPVHCTGDLTDQEKVLLYMLFDLGACVGEPPIAPPCVPVTCSEVGARCGFAPDGCGNILDCGACRPPA